MTIEKSEITKQVEKEHENIKKDMSILLDEVMREIPAEKFSDWKIDFIWKLRDFRNHLSKHFDYEDNSGFMDELKIEAPENLKHAQQLEDDHDVIVKDLDHILEDLKKIPNKDRAKIEVVQTKLSKFIARLRAHEHAENSLIQKVYCQEYGYPSS